MTKAQDGVKVVSLTHRSPLPPGNAPGAHFCSRLSRPQGHSVVGRILCQRKIPMTPAGIEPATFRFVAQHLNHCATAVPYPLESTTNFIFHHSFTRTPLSALGGTISSSWNQEDKIIVIFVIFIYDAQISIVFTSFLALHIFEFQPKDRQACSRCSRFARFLQICQV